MHDVIPHVVLIQQFSDRLVQARAFDVQKHQPGMFPMQFEHLAKSRDSRISPELSRIAKLELLEIFPQIFRDIPITFQQMIDHVVMKADQHPIPGLSYIDFIPIPSQFETRPIRFQSIFVREFDCTAMANQMRSLPSFRDTSMPEGIRLRRFPRCLPS